jgi:GntR family transcriptional regulator of vanillate catabolism
MSTQVQQILVELREMILNGKLEPGERLAEIPLAERLKVSRTPVRHALALLDAEGLIRSAGVRGYEVRRFRVPEILDAIDVRGALESLAARLVARNGVTRQLRSTLEACLTEGQAVLDATRIDPDGLARFAAMNQELHTSIVDEAGSDPLKRALSINNRLPFAAAGSVAWKSMSENDWRRMIFRARIEHEQIVEALLDSDAARAEFLMREHVNVAKASVRVLANAQADAPDGGFGLRLVGS